MFLLVPASPGSPGSKAVKLLCVCVCVCVCACACVLCNDLIVVVHLSYNVFVCTFQAVLLCKL